MVLLNDLGATVDVAWCGDEHCHSLAGTVHDRLAPGERLAVNVSGEGFADFYRIDQEDQRGYRCLRLSIKDEQPHSVVPLSDARDCETGERD